MTDYTLKQCTDLLQSKQISAYELASEYLNAIDAKNAQINGFITIDKDITLAEAKAADERIATLYDLWYEQKEEILRTYTDEMPKRISLADNPEFKSVKNAVIQEAMRLIADTVSGLQTVSKPTNSKIKTSRLGLAAASVTRLFHYVSRILQDRLEGQKEVDQRIDRKLRRKIEEKKQLHGLKQE